MMPIRMIPAIKIGVTFFGFFFGIVLFGEEVEK